MSDKLNDFCDGCEQYTDKTRVVGHAHLCDKCYKKYVKKVRETNNANSHLGGRH